MDGSDLRIGDGGYMDGKRDMMEQPGCGERGMISLLGVCALGILMFLAATLYTVGMSRNAAVQRFLVQDELRNGAEDGVRLAVSKMNGDSATVTRAEGAASDGMLLITGRTGEVDFEVYARNKGDKILLLSVGKKDGNQSRAVGVLKRKNGKYIIEHWER